MSRTVANLLVLLCLGALCSAKLHAQIGGGHNCFASGVFPINDGVRAIPTIPASGQPFVLEIFGYRGTSPVPVEAVTIERQGATIRIDARINDAFGFAVGSTYCRRETHPALPTGEYVVEYYVASPLGSGGYGPPVLVQSLPLSILPNGGRRIIPASSVVGEVLLALVLLAFGTALLRRPD